MKKFIIIICALSACFTGCNDDEPVAPAAPDEKIVINFSTQSLSSSVLKSSASEQEEQLTKVILFGFESNNSFVEKYTLTNPSLTGNEVTVSKKVKTIYAIANPATAMDITPANVEALTGLTGDFTAAPQSPFLMSGNGTVANGTVSIILIRSIAKILITSSNEEFQITSVTVKNTPNMGYVFAQTPLSVPGAKTDYPAVNSATPTLYVAENTASNPTKFVVAGLFDGKTASYEIILKNDGNVINIERNKCYSVTINPITDTSCTSIISIPEWVDEKTDEQRIDI